MTEKQMYRLSELQEGIWYQEKLYGSRRSHNVPIRFDFTTRPDHAHLQTVINTLINAHYCFHTRITEDGSGLPRQYMQTPSPVKLRIVALKESNEEYLVLRLEEETAIPFALRDDALYRITLFEHTKGAATLLFVIHHIIFDGQSAAVFSQDFIRLWSKEQSSLVQAHDIAAQTYLEMLFSESPSERSMEYWRKMLADAPSEMLLPFSGRGETDTRQAGTVIKHIAHDISERITSLCQAYSVTPFMLHTVACTFLLMRYSQSQDIVLGVPISIRNDKASTLVAGLFVNVLPLRLIAQADTTASTMLGQIRNRLVRTMMHRNVTFHQLVRELHPERTSFRNPFFQVCVNYARVSERELTSESVRAVPIPNAVAAFELDFILAEHDDSLKIILEYRKGCFDEETISSMLRHYCTLLDEITRNLSCTLASVNMMSQAEREVILNCWNPSVKDGRAETSVLSLFERQAAEQPLSVALCYRGGEMRYEELNRKANQLAHYLKSQNITAGQRVAVSLPRNPDFIVAIYGILKTGATYVPIDPDYPEDRKQFLLENSGAVALIASGIYGENRIDAGVPVFELCNLIDILRDQPKTNPVGQPSLDDVIYCIYTSGSTGEPKGALNTHRSIANLVYWYVHEALKMSPGEKVIIASSFSFDLTQKNIFGPLSCGGSVIIPDSSPADAIGFLRALSAFQPDYLCCAPSAYRAFAGSSRCQSLKKIVLGGEVIEPALAETILNSGKVLINSYGPTECADIAIWSEYLPDSPLPIGTIPLGCPIPGCRIYILDDFLNPVPQGIDGEIYIGGVGVGLGYLNRDDMTQEKFIRNPFDGGGRMYRTGDRGRYRSDGVIEFTGRRDGQIKLRGFRIEPSEIESAIQSTELVDQVCVQACSAHGNGQKLVAWFVSAKGKNTTRAEIAGCLKQILPAHMIPDTWVRLDAMPVSPNGKTDRLRLTVPEENRDNNELEVLPSGTLTKLIADIWQQELGLNRLSVNDNFFQCGGHSLLAIVCLARINQKLGLTLPGTAIAHYQTIDELASFITENRLDESPPYKIWFPSSGPVIWFFPAAGLRSTAYRHLAESFAPECELRILEYPEHDAVESASIEALQAYFCHQIETFSGSREIILAGHSFGATIAFEVGRYFENAGLSVRLIVIDGTLTSPEQFFGSSKSPQSSSEQNGVVMSDFFSSESFHEALRHMTSESDALYQHHVSLFCLYQPEGCFDSDTLVILGAEGEIYRQLQPKHELYYKDFFPELNVLVSSGEHMSLVSAEHANRLSSHIKTFVIPAI
ncbi:non-ribosomal peptide synthetase [Xenorhabdus ishibashii]|uniref:Amino acid adenylation n=1 Tax=Xenorhabdus ishibashii TaxID=1034471 RepID=A0A2D0KE44_9GAMM|nr:non-ribosomal peptide synthetase [Xenorhabdus ishibashii]PHM61688.1 Amino acid adenylation [Xenorhabdus ishibashii]